MKLPNGYGSVYKLSGNRRNPYAARKTIGWTFDEEKQRSQPIYKFIGYYPTKKEALQALSAYNTDPYSVKKDLTISELYEKWSAIEFSNCSESFERVYKASYKVLEPIYSSCVSKLTLDSLQTVLDQSGKNEPVLKKVKSLICKLYDYALMYDLITPGKREMVNHIKVDAKNPNNLERIPFSTEEIENLWKCGESAHGILVMIYTGLRISEFANLRPEDVHMEDRWFSVRKSKTKAGIRSVPIADKILPVFEEWIAKGNEFVFQNCSPATEKGKVSYFLWDSMMKRFEMEHTPHDARHTAISRMIKANVNLTLVKKIVGHAAGNVTEDVYSHADLKDKLKAINKI